MISAHWKDGRSFIPQKILCVAKNYLEHAKEMGDGVPEEPVFFLKPNSALVPAGAAVPKPAWTNDLQHEVELAVRIGHQCSRVHVDKALAMVDGYAVGLDFTARDVQRALKAAGLPWEKAKAYDGSCALSPFVSAAEVNPHFPLELILDVNGQRRQQGTTQQMIHDIAKLVAHASTYFTLHPGDVLLTGTPAGVCTLVPGDLVYAAVAGVADLQLTIQEA